MSEQTGIEWTHHTFNPWWGCVKVSPACTNCYAEALARRYGHEVWGGEAPRRFFGEKHWQEPVRWNRAAADAGARRRVFCASMADVFEDRAELDDWRGRLYGLIDATPMLDWLLLTKRPENIRAMLPADWLTHERSNVWFGTTVENQHFADERIPLLLQTPAAVRFISAEPLLGPVDLSGDADPCRRWLRSGASAVRGVLTDRWVPPLDWVIAGGESGPGARPSHPDWFRSLRDQCQAAGVPFFFKQWGGLRPKSGGRLLDGVEWNQFPGEAP